jgi:hypothetical protein
MFAMAVHSETTTARGAPPWWRRGPVVAGIVVLLLGTELLLGWSSLAEALAQLRAPAWHWVAAAVAVELASMRSYARMQHTLLHGAGTKVSLRRHVATAYAAHAARRPRWRPGASRSAAPSPPAR